VKLFVFDFDFDFGFDFANGQRLRAKGLKVLASSK